MVDVIDNDGYMEEEAGRSSSVSTHSYQEVVLHAYLRVAPISGVWEDKSWPERKPSRGTVSLLAGCKVAAPENWEWSDIWVRTAYHEQAANHPGLRVVIQSFKVYPLQRSRALLRIREVHASPSPSPWIHRLISPLTCIHQLNII